ncbi:hypothetical protein FACS1894151_03340 [Spirochaetia bacterium]|nr:hypothetical protein FACS1894151_03340 [Spirochaetia bacterium]
MKRIKNHNKAKNTAHILNESTGSLRQNIQNLKHSSIQIEYMTNSKVSVVIPVYNVEQYLCRCLDSVTAQTLRDIEIICVNDGSTDNSLEILREYEQKDRRLKVIDFTENRGVFADIWTKGM